MSLTPVFLTRGLIESALGSAQNAKAMEIRLQCKFRIAFNVPGMLSPPHAS